MSCYHSITFITRTNKEIGINEHAKKIDNNFIQNENIKMIKKYNDYQTTFGPNKE